MGHGAQGRVTPPARVDVETAKTVAATLQALAAPSRLLILGRLRQGACSVGELASAVGMERSAWACATLSPAPRRASRRHRGSTPPLRVGWLTPGRGLGESCRVESATQTLHRLTSLASFELGREWEVPVDDPRVLRDLVVNDLSRFPWFSSGTRRHCPRCRFPVRPGAIRHELYRVCLDQGLAHDAAFVVIAAADLSALDDRQYREAQLTAGLVEGRLHLLAYSLGASASGVTFVDGKVPALLGEHRDGLLFTCIGVPEYAPAAGGLPGAPTAIPTVTPRNDIL